METETKSSATYQQVKMNDMPEEIDLEIFKTFSEDIERAFKAGIESVERNFKENLLDIKSLFFDKMN
jgi:23S rRNA maturation-related 3'-5' exoribonuclease YhaM